MEYTSIDVTSMSNMELVGLIREQTGNRTGFVSIREMVLTVSGTCRVLINGGVVQLRPNIGLTISHANIRSLVVVEPGINIYAVLGYRVF